MKQIMFMFGSGAIMKVKVTIFSTFLWIIPLMGTFMIYHIKFAIFVRCLI